MRSHFLPQKATAVCAVAGATTLFSGTASAQNFLAADYATNSTYASSWAAGQNGGYGFGAWSFDGTADINGNPDPGAQQGISSASAIGTAWSLFNSTANPPPGGPGISDVGRAINEPGGLQPGQTLEVVMQNPTAYHFYRGFDFLCLNGTDNDPAGNGVAAIRAQVFDYFSSNWNIVDDFGGAVTPLSSASTAAGMKFDLTLTSTNTYAVTLTPLSNPSAAYSQTGELTTNLPINWINFRLYLGPSTGVNDTVDNFSVSSMTIEGLPLNIQVTGTNAVLSWLDIPGYYLETATRLGPTANWISNSISPLLINGDNVITNPIAGHQQFFRLQLQQ
jgi:hypothetical protein